MTAHTQDIQVIQEGAQIYFELKDFRFQSLSAHPLFEGGKLEIIFKGEVIAQTNCIEFRGTHAANLCFVGLETAPVASIDAEDYMPGTLIRVTFTAEEKFDLKEYLKHLIEIQERAKAVLDRINEMPLTDFLDLLQQDDN